MVLLTRTGPPMAHRCERQAGHSAQLPALVSFGCGELPEHRHGLIYRRRRSLARARISADRALSDTARASVMAPTIVDRATMASPRACLGSRASLARAMKSFSSSSVAAIFVSLPDRTISLPRAANGQIGVGESRCET